jgi:hypothetical protein
VNRQRLVDLASMQYKGVQELFVNLACVRKICECYSSRFLLVYLYSVNRI